MLILGGDDVGKTTILDAIALLLSPTNTAIVSDGDYWRRKLDDGKPIRLLLNTHWHGDHTGGNKNTGQGGS